MTKENKKSGLELLRDPFPDHQISKLPKPTKAQTEAVKADFKKGIRCQLCGQWHHPDVVHLDYVGHAALTDRLLDCDANWSWEPISFDQNGSPFLDKMGGLWIRLTVCGVTRLGYGHPDGKSGGDAVKEAIGDALRNAAMRFGAALDLWHKGDLHIDTQQEQDIKQPTKQEQSAEDKEKAAEDWTVKSVAEIMECKTRDDLRLLMEKKSKGIEKLNTDQKERIFVKADVMNARFDNMDMDASYRFAG